MHLPQTPDPPFPDGLTEPIHANRSRQHSLCLSRVRARPRRLGPAHLQARRAHAAHCAGARGLRLQHQLLRLERLQLRQRQRPPGAARALGGHLPAHRGRPRDRAHRPQHAGAQCLARLRLPSARAAGHDQDPIHRRRAPYLLRHDRVHYRRARGGGVNPRRAEQVPQPQHERHGGRPAHRGGRRRRRLPHPPQQHGAQRASSLRVQHDAVFDRGGRPAARLRVPPQVVDLPHRHQLPS